MDGYKIKDDDICVYVYLNGFAFQVLAVVLLLWLLSSLWGGLRKKGTEMVAGPGECVVRKRERGSGAGETVRNVVVGDTARVRGSLGLGFLL